MSILNAKQINAVKLKAIFENDIETLMNIVDTCPHLEEEIGRSVSKILTKKANINRSIDEAKLPKEMRL